MVEYDGEQIIQNDYSVENLLRLAQYLDWEIEELELSEEEYERRFC